MGREVFEATQIDNVTSISPATILVLLVAGILVTVLDRRYVLVAFMTVVLVVPSEQRLAVAGLDLYVFRLLVIVAWIRVALRREWGCLRLNRLDKVLLAFVVSTSLAYVLLRGDLAAVVNRLGEAMDYLGFYFLLRVFVREVSDVRHLVGLLLVMEIPIVSGMVLEQLLNVNVFGVLRGNTSVYWREGAVRSQAAFAHPIAAGAFGASLFPLAVGWYMVSRRRKGLAVAGVLASVAIVVASKSSGPVLALAGAVAAIGLYGLRKHMRLVVVGAVASLLVLQLYMKSPIWALIDRVGIFGGSTSYHRFLLVDQFIRRAPEWLMFGVLDTGHWSPYVGMQLWDVANQYVRVGVDGGIVALGLFLGYLGLAYQGIGMALRLVEHDLSLRWLFWSIGASLFTHMVAFLGVSYSTQIFAVLMANVAFASLARDLSTGHALAGDLPGAEVGWPREGSAGVGCTEA